MNELSIAVLDEAAPVFAHISRPSGPLIDLARSFEKEDALVVCWRATTGSTAARELMNALIDGWRLPDVHAANWNAIAEGLHVQGMQGRTKAVLIVDDADLFARANPVQWEAGRRTLTELGEEWRARGGILRVITIGE